MGVSVRLDMGPLLKLKADARPKAARHVARFAFIVQGQAELKVPVDTGALKNSIRAIASRDDLEWEVIVTQAYASFVEFGTSKMQAKPYLVPAVEGQRGAFADAMKDLFEP